MFHFRAKKFRKSDLEDYDNFDVNAAADAPKGKSKFDYQTIIIKNLAQEKDKKVLAINWSHQGDSDGEIFPLVKQIIFQKPLPFKQLICLLGEVL